MLKRVGLGMEGVYGGFGGEKYSLEAVRMIAVARR
jgi:hypothetical protein